MALSKAETVDRLMGLVCEDFAFDNLQSPLTQMPQAAVLVSLVWSTESNDLEVLLTKRSQKVSSYKGHVCFPGGMRDKEDKNEIENALREAEEEIGLKPEKVQVLGVSVPFISRTGVLMRTVIGLVDESFVPKPNDEVEFAFKLPIRRFLSREGHTCFPYNHAITGQSRHIHSFQDTVLGQHSVETFGITAQVLLELAVAVYKRQPEFDDFQNDIFSDFTPFHYQRKLLTRVETVKQHGNGKL